MVKRSRRRPLTAKTAVRFRYELLCIFDTAQPRIHTLNKGVFLFLYRKAQSKMQSMMKTVNSINQIQRNSIFFNLCRTCRVRHSLYKVKGGSPSLSMDKNIDFEEQYDKIYRYCYFKVQRRETAEDIAQETFLRFLESERYQNTGKSLQYLYTVARNLCIDEYRRKGREPLPEEYAEQEAVTQGQMGNTEEERRLNTIVLREALLELEEKDRELLLLRYVNEVPVSVICKLHGMSRFALYRRIKEILKVLRDELGKENFA